MAVGHYLYGIGFVDLEGRAYALDGHGWVMVCCLSIEIAQISNGREPAMDCLYKYAALQGAAA
jgi:hypothetical protein